MSTHIPPSSYMLKNFAEIDVLPVVSWWPQTLGWQLVALCLVLFAVFHLAKYIHFCWLNRYRKEALSALAGVSELPTEQQATRVFFVLKTALAYLEPSMAKASGNEFLGLLDEKLVVERPSSTLLSNQFFGGGFNKPLGERWQRSLFDSSQVLSEQQLNDLLLLSEHWLNHHQGPQAFSLRAFWRKQAAHHA
ncbi:DUF4381 domain-containing protein [Agarivorans sp. 1_MG-2023]|uniref:DUF4381 domain-containing protein n=1 Tax=Agarivorans sp. 1_MG-2023 TaxID=3062634 RepID=UPI0026E26439|nr:DUF4381 domain-containing protein [Agarivorans sp. 1_MG-2023]MDO6765961.1 DUF4381 domain-containing protein [Agarivorans sp. 1_MG-2023]